MKFVVYGPERRVGLLAGDQVVDVNGASAKFLRDRQNEPLPSPMANALAPADLQAFIEGGKRTLDHTQQATDYALSQGDRAGLVHKLADVTIHAPRPSVASRIACAGGNYAQHAAGMEGGGASAEEVFRRAREAGMWGFWKINAEIAGPDGEIPYPARTQRFDYEGEAAVVLGQRGRDFTQAQARDAVWGVTLFMDWSIRDGGGGGGAARPMSFNLAKNFDGSTSMGPCIAVGEVDPQAVEVRTLVNGELRQNYSSKDMTFSFAEYLEYLSQDLTFLPGDVISAGTGAGTAMESARADGGAKFLKVGDSVEVVSPQVGSLKTHIVAKR
ncbi:MAG TPA: fumarylacetoacetate hydrolase family protein [Chloroflexota bacterium]|nr:fumarylacetoacetate hydrolase family protein [Chloroflexota bacterium]